MRMKFLSRDITFTLIFKLALMFVLWFSCFKGTRHPVGDLHAWFFSPNTQNQEPSNERLKR